MSVPLNGRANGHACNFSIMRSTHVRVLSDNIVESRDDRQMSFVARGLGFVHAADVPANAD